MRRIGAFALASSLIFTGFSAGATSYENIKDKFLSIGWGGSDGSLPWSGSWQENGDDGDEKFGNVRVVSSGNCASGNCMQIGALTTILSGPIGATRRADTGGLDELELCFDIKATGSLLGSQLQVQVNGGGGWRTVKQYPLEGEFSEHRTVDVGEFGSEDFQVRFRFTSTILGSEVYIDNVEIRGVVADDDDDDGVAGSTTTTTTIGEGTSTTTEPRATTTTTTGANSTTTTAPRATTTTRQDEDSTSTTTTSSSTSTTTIPSTSSTLVGPDRKTPGVAGASPTTTTTAIPSEEPGGSGEGISGTGPEGSGIRAAARGLQASFQGDLYGEVRTVSSINGVDLRADYNMAVEIIRASWAWVVVLALLVAWAILSGLERRREDFDA